MESNDDGKMDRKQMLGRRTRQGTGLIDGEGFIYKGERDFSGCLML